MRCKNLALIVCLISFTHFAAVRMQTLNGACDPICQTCKGPGPNDCLSCGPGRFFYKGSCIRKCSDNLFGTILSRICADHCENINEFGDPTEKICKKCHGSCRTCLGPSEKDCLSCDGIVYKEFVEGQRIPAQCACKSGYYFDESTSLCEVCHSSCLTCTGKGYDKCSTCKILRGFDKTSLAVYGTCFCQENFYDNLDGECIEKGGQEHVGWENTLKSIVLISLAALLGLESYAVMGLFFNLIDISQQLSYIIFFNLSFPLNMYDVLKYLYRFNMQIFFPNIFHIIGEHSGSIVVEYTPFGYINHVEEQDSHVKFAFQSISKSFLANSGGSIFFFMIFPWPVMFISRYLERRFKPKFLTWPTTGFWGIMSTLVQFSLKLFGKRDFIYWTFFLTLQEMALFTFLQFKYVSFNNGFNTASFVICCVFFVYQLALIGSICYTVWKELPDRQAEQQRFTSLYYIYNAVNMINLESPKKTLTPNPAKKNNSPSENMTDSTKNRLVEGLKEGQKLEEELYANQTEKYPHLFSPLQRGQLAGRVYVVVRYVRKMLISLLIVQLFDNVSLQVIAFGSLALVSYAYLRITEPLKNRLYNTLMEMSELMQVFTSFTLFLFTKTNNSVMISYFARPPVLLIVIIVCLHSLLLLTVFLIKVAFPFLLRIIRNFCRIKMNTPPASTIPQPDKTVDETAKEFELSNRNISPEKQPLKQEASYIENISMREDHSKIERNEDDLSILRDASRREEQQKPFFQGEVRGNQHPPKGQEFYYPQQPPMNYFPHPQMNPIQQAPQTITYVILDGKSAQNFPLPGNFLPQPFNDSSLNISNISHKTGRQQDLDQDIAKDLEALEEEENRTSKGKNLKGKTEGHTNLENLRTQDDQLSQDQIHFQNITKVSAKQSESQFGLNDKQSEASKCFAKDLQEASSEKK